MYSLKFQSYHAKAVPASPPHTFGSYWLGGRVRLVVGGEIVFNNKNNVAVGHHNFLPVLILVEVGFKALNDNFCFPLDLSLCFCFPGERHGRVYPLVRVRHCPPLSSYSLWEF